MFTKTCWWSGYGRGMGMEAGGVTKDPSVLAWGKDIEVSVTALESQEGGMLSWPLSQTLPNAFGQASLWKQLHGASPQLHSQATYSVQPRPLREVPLADPQKGCIPVVQCLVCMEIWGVATWLCLPVEQGSYWKRLESATSLADRDVLVIFPFFPEKRSSEKREKWPRVTKHRCLGIQWGLGQDRSRR